MSFLLADEQNKVGQLRDQHQQLGSRSGSNKKKNTNTSKSSSSQGKGKASHDYPYPSEFYCPISHCLMLEPVMDREGNTYERASIEQWLSEHNTSPITRNSLNVNDLAINRALVGLIEAELERGGDELELEQIKVWQEQRDQKRRDALPCGLSESDIQASVVAKYIVQFSTSYTRRTSQRLDRNGSRRTRTHYLRLKQIKKLRVLLDSGMI